MNAVEAVEYMMETGKEVTVDTWHIRYKLFKNDIIGAMVSDNYVPCADKIVRTWSINDFISSWEDVKKSAASNLDLIIV